MRAQVSLTPTESKKLIAKAVAKMELVQNAFEKGMVAIHPSSTTIFIVEELTGKLPETEVWVCGIITPKGTCLSLETMRHRRIDEAGNILRSPADFPHTWVIEKGKLRSDIPLGEILDQMQHDDVYIKGANALDVNNTAGVLIGNLIEGGTIGLVLSRAKRQGIKLVFPIGLEKLLPISIKKAAEEAAKRKFLDYSMGLPCALLPCKGIVVTELVALELLTGTSAIPIGAGGLGGAEGGITMVLKGNDAQVSKAIEYIEGVKGTLPPREVIAADCTECKNELCSLRGGAKHWC
jgi:hypothetical protein